MKFRRWMSSLLIQGVFLTVHSGFFLAAGEEPPPKKLPLEEKVDVQVAEFVLLVTDKAGRPITDLRPQDLTVSEGGKKQKLAFLEPAGKQVQERSWAITAPAPVPLYDGKTAVPAAESPQVPAPPPVRRIVLAFDPKNSRLRVRETWRTAAQKWIETSMEETDRVAVVGLGGVPEWFAGPTCHRGELIAAVERACNPANTPNRDRVGEITLFADAVRNGCGQEQVGSKARSGLGWSCAVDVARPTVEQWWRESAESVDALRALVGQLGAFPDRKTVILFSEGIVPDPSEVAGVAIQSVLGSAQQFSAAMTWGMDRNVTRDLKLLQREARAASVSFWTLDTRPTSQRRALSENFENPTRPVSPVQTFGVDPWMEMYETTRGAMGALARETSGRYAAGSEGLKEKITAAAGAEAGTYLVGYYRGDPGTPMERIKVKLARRGAQADLPDQAEFQSRAPRHLRLDLSMGTPEATGEGNRVSLPVKFQVSFDALPLRREGGLYGCQLGALLQAIRPDGTLAAETFENVIPVLNEKPAEGAMLEHILRIVLDPGPYRLRARLADDHSTILGDTIIDLTVSLAGLTPGFQIPKPQ